MTIEDLEKRGVDPRELMRKTNLSALLVDVIGLLEDSIQDDFEKVKLYKFNQKKDLNKLRKASEALVDSTYKAINSEKVYLDYLDDAAYLFDVLMLLSKKTNHVQVLSTLKLIK